MIACRKYAFNINSILTIFIIIIVCLILSLIYMNAAVVVITLVINTVFLTSIIWTTLKESGEVTIKVKDNVF